MIFYMSVYDKYTPISKEISHKIKGESVGGLPISEREQREAIEVAADDMAKLIPSNAILVPVPSRKGYATSTKMLADAISKRNKAVVKDVLRGRNRMSSYVMKQKGQEVSAIDFGLYLTEPLQGKVFFIDNVISSGATARAVCSVCNGVFVVYASVGNPSGMKRIEPMRKPMLTKRGVRHAMLM